MMSEIEKKINTIIKIIYKFVILVNKTINDCLSIGKNKKTDEKL